MKKNPLTKLGKTKKEIGKEIVTTEIVEHFYTGREYKPHNKIAEQADTTLGEAILGAGGNRYTHSYPYRP